MTKPGTSIVPLIVTVLFFVTLPAVAQGQDTTPGTTENVEIPVEDLKILVKPMTAEELQVEAEAWFDILHATCTQIARDQLIVHKMNEIKDQAEEEIEAAEEIGAATVEDVEFEAEVTEARADMTKDEMLRALNELRDDKAALIDRLNVVLDSWEAKGGDVASYRAYIAENTRMEVEVKDTSAAWAMTKGWILSEQGGQRWMWNIIQFVITLLITWLVAHGIASLVRSITSHSGGKMSKLAQDALARAFALGVWVVGIVISLSALEVNITPMIAAIGAAGLVIGLALQGTLSNIASGVMILLNRPFDVDDVVTAAGVTGKVAEMSLVATIFKTFDNQTVIIPNNEIWGQVITNITANDTRRIDMIFGISYSDDIGKAEKILQEILAADERVLDDPAPNIKVHELGDSSVNFICRPWVKTSEYWDVYWDTTRTVKEQFDAQGVSIPFPQRDVHFYREDNGKEDETG